MLELCSLLNTLKLSFLGPLKQSSTTAEVTVVEVYNDKSVPPLPGKFGSDQPFISALATKPVRMYGRKVPISSTTLQVSIPYTETLHTACCSKHEVVLVCLCIQSKSKQVICEVEPFYNGHHWHLICCPF